MTKLQINLSSRPFVNYTPYHLGYVVIGLAGLLLLAHNAFWFFSNHGDVRLMEQEIAALQTEVDGNIRGADALAEEIDQIQRNRRFREVVNFVDGRIRQRRFSWIRMLNLLQDAIPADVKIESITPRVQANSVRIMLACMAKKATAVNEFIENLENIEDFSRVLISSEDREGSIISFPLTMEYSPWEEAVDRGTADEVDSGADQQGAPGGAAPAPEPGSLAEAISRAELPDPDMLEMDFPEIGADPDQGISDPFAVEGDDPFADGGEMFGETGGFGGGSVTAPATAPETAAGPPPKTGVSKPKNTGNRIKRPPRKPGDKPNRTRPPGRQPGGRS